MSTCGLCAYSYWPTWCVLRSIESHSPIGVPSAQGLSSLSVELFDLASFLLSGTGGNHLHLAVGSRVWANPLWCRKNSKGQARCLEGRLIWHFLLSSVRRQLWRSGSFQRGNLRSIYGHCSRSYNLRFPGSHWYGTVSKTLEKSKIATSTWLPWSLFCMRSCVVNSS